MEMTEETLRKASCLNDQINDLQAKRKDLLSAEKICCGNTEDIKRRTFRISISEINSTREYSVRVSADVARAALDKEIEKTQNKIKVLQEEFSEL